MSLPWPLHAIRLYERECGFECLHDGARPLKLLFGANALALLVLGIAWNPVMAWCQAAFA